MNFARFILLLPLIVCFVVLAMPSPAHAALLDVKASPEVMIGLVALFSFLVTQVLKPLMEKLSPQLKTYAPIAVAMIAALLTGAEAGQSIGTIFTGILSGGLAMGGYDIGKIALGFFKLIGVTQAPSVPKPPTDP